MDPMVKILVLGISAGTFVLQLCLCFRCWNAFRYIPVCVLGSAEIALWGSFFLIRPGFYTYYAAVMTFIWLIAGLLAWIIWGVVQLIQKRKE